MRQPSVFQRKKDSTHSLRDSFVDWGYHLLYIGRELSAWRELLVFTSKFGSHFFRLHSCQCWSIEMSHTIIPLAVADFLISAWRAPPEWNERAERTPSPLRRMDWWPMACLAGASCHQSCCSSTWLLFTDGFFVWLWQQQQQKQRCRVVQFL